MAITENYKPLQQLSNLPYFQKKGQLLFDFPYSTDINHRIFDVIDWLMKHMGHKNMQIEQKELRIHLQLRSAFISTSNHNDFAELLDEYCLSGSIHLLPEGIYLKSDYQYITSYVHEDIKEWILEQARRNNQTQSDFVANCLVRIKQENEQNG